MKKNIENSLTIAEAAALVGVSYPTLWRHVQSGEIPSVHLGAGMIRRTAVRINRRDIEKFMKRRTGKGDGQWAK